MWEQILANRRRSVVLIVGMAVILVLIGFAGGELIAPDAGVVGLLLALLIWGGMLIAYFTSAEDILMHGAFARELKREDSPQLFNVVDEMRLASGLDFMPRIYLIDDPAPNAFAIGRKPETSAIAVTTGLMYRLNRDELQGVIAHEIGHLKNRDVQFMTLAAVMLGTIIILSQIVTRSLWYGGRGRSRSESRGGSGGGQAQIIILIVGVLFLILGPIMAQLLYFACSRKREYLADASGAQFTRYPEGLASALEKISQAHIPLSFASKATAPMFIVNPLTAADEEDEPDSVFASHPPSRERIRILRAMTGASFADYEAAYRRAKGGALIGARTLQTASQEAIRQPSGGGPIQTRQDSHDIARRSAGYLRLRCNCGLEISVPEGYEQDSIRCFRCGSVLPIPSATDAPPSPQPMPPILTAAIPPVIPFAPMQFHRSAGGGWESFRCACGRTIQLSPAFDASQIRCESCGRTIAVT
jgi:heat shock protein HtpX